MAKALDWVSFNLNGTEGADNSATLTACVCDTVDTDLKKTVSMTCTPPAADEDWDNWRAAQIAALKTAQGIS